MPVLENVDAPLWFVISADGLQSKLTTSKASFCMHPQWNSAFRLIVQVPDIMGAYLYVTLCSYAQNKQDVVALARARVGLRSLPFGTPKQFRFPLMLTTNSAIDALNLYLIATLSSFTQPVAPEIAHSTQNQPVAPLSGKGYHSNHAFTRA